MLRWWWFGPSVERAELDRELTEMARAGFGGVEVAYVYPLGPATTEFLSEQFLGDLRFAAERAGELGLRFDLTLGSGWSFGGPHITADLAARRLHWERREIQPGAVGIPVTVAWPGDELVAAYLGAGSLQEPPDSYDPLAVTDGQLRIPAGSGTRVVLLAYARLTGQNVKRAAAGAEGPVLDHYSAAAAESHLAGVGDRLLDAVPAELIGSVFCDSLEAYGADWTPALAEEFARRRGYELGPVLYQLVADGPDAATLRADYHRTLAELYEENFVAVCHSWAADRGVRFRLQSYGTPPATLSSYRFADLFEGEGWGWRELTPSRWASSAAHLYGRDIASAEVWTWVHSPSFRATPVDLKGEAHEHLLSGINQLVGHGWPYSPADAPGLGWMFYAAGAVDDRNPWWPAMPELNAYLRRLCWLLRQGEPVADVAVYVPNDDLFATMGLATGGSLDTWREANRRIPSEIPATIRSVGLDFDLLDDEAADGTSPDRYRVVVVPTTTMLGQRTATWLQAVREAGGTVILVDSEVEVPGAVVVAPDELADALPTAADPDLELTPHTPDVGFVHRRLAGIDTFLLVNTGPIRREFRAAARDRRRYYQEWDASTGRVRRRGETGGGIFVSLHPYEATTLVLTDDVPDEDLDREGRRPLNWRRLGGDWQVSFAGGPLRPVELPHVWEEQPGRRHFSGRARYRTVVELAGLKPSSTVELDLGESRELSAAETDSEGLVGASFRARLTSPVGEVAAITVNEVECGLLWAPPYRLDVSAAVRPGPNEIEITVFNTGANALAGDEDIRRLAAQSEQQYGRRFRLQDLDRAMATVRSGLFRPPSIGIN